jgi:hypothetical protein
MDTCDHCGRLIGTEGGDGYAIHDGMTLCHPDPTGSPRPNCFKLVATYSHRRDCKICAQAGMAVRR